MDYKRQRRSTGLILGLVLGGGYSLSVNLANRIILPGGIPLYSPPPGDYWMFLITTLMFGMLGLIAAWGEESLPNILASGLTGSLLTWFWSLINDSSNPVGMIGLMIVVVPPLVFLYLPFGALVRWLITKLDQPTPAPTASVRKFMPVFASFVVLLVLGSFRILPKETRTSLVNMQDLLEAGLQVESTSYRDLPKPLQSVEGFVPNATGDYSFIIGSNPDVLPVLRPVVEYRVPEPVIIVRFENGFQFGCVFSPPYIVPVCIDL